GFAGALRHETERPDRRAAIAAEIDHAQAQRLAFGAGKSYIAVKIRDARSELAGSHKGIEWLVEKHARIGSHLVREVAAPRAFARVWIVGRADFGKQQHPGIVQRERREHHGRGGRGKIRARSPREMGSGGPG